MVEMQFDAFAYPAFEQVVSHVAKLRNRTRGVLSVPMVIRVPYAGGIGGVEHHCDSSEAYYAHTPGLKVVTPATVADAYGLLREAIDDPDPVVFLEPKRLYFSRADVELGRGAKIGEAQVLRAGTDVTLIAYDRRWNLRCRQPPQPPTKAEISKSSTFGPSHPLTTRA